MRELFDYVDAGDVEGAEDGGDTGDPYDIPGQAGRQGDQRGWNRPHINALTWWRKVRKHEPSAAEAAALKRIARLGADARTRNDESDERQLEGAILRLQFFAEHGREAHGPEVDRINKEAAQVVQAHVNKYYAEHPSGGLLSGIGHAFSSAVHLAEDVGTKFQRAAGVLTNNPIWDIARYGAAHIPGIGSAVSSGMAGLSAVGRAESLADIGLAAAKGALPPEVAAGLDIALGAMKHGLGPGMLAGIRNNLPGGDAIKGAFDAGVAIASGKGQDVVNRLAGQQSEAARSVFQKALTAHGNPRRDTGLGGDTRPQLGGRTRVKRVHLPHRPPNVENAFPFLGYHPNRVAAAMIRNPELRGQTPAQIRRLLTVSTDDARRAMAAFLTRFHGQREYDARDVGELETFDQAASRHGVDVGYDLGEWPGDTGAIHTMAMPPVRISRGQLHRIYERGDATMKRAMLAHELLAHVARNTGELEGTTWLIRGNGDWPSVVAKTVTGDGSRWKELLAVNPTFKLQTNGNIPQWTKGTRVNIPPSWIPSSLAQGAAQPGSSAPPFPSPSEYPLGFPSAIYVVRAGDTGEKVAARITGNKDRWRELLKTNPTLADAKYGIALYAGKQVKLPDSWVKPQQTAAAQIAQQAAQQQAQGGPAQQQQPAQVEKSGGVWQQPAQTSPPVGGQTPVTGSQTTPAMGQQQPGQQQQPSSSTPASTPSSTPASTPATTSSSPIVTGSAEQIATVQLMLGAFYREHPDAAIALHDAEAFGKPEDFAGQWTDRTTMALLGFEKWWNARRNSPVLHEDGLPDGAAIQALMDQTAADGGTVDARSPVQLAVRGVQQKAATSPTPAKKKSDAGPLLGLGLLLAALGS